MEQVQVLSLPIALDTRISTGELLALTQDSINVTDTSREMNAFFAVNGVSNPGTDVYLSVYSHNGIIKAGVFIPHEELGVYMHPDQIVPSVDQLITQHCREGRFLGWRSFLQDTPELMTENVPRFAPARLRNCAGALLGFVNTMAYYSFKDQRS